MSKSWVSAKKIAAWFVFCASDDLSAIWAYRGLRARGVAPLELVSAEMLAYSLLWEHRVTAEGASVRIVLADKRTICSETTRGALNRLVSVPSEHLGLATPPDREYASQELFALFVSWLHALPGPVLNRPTPQGLSGRWRHSSEWAWLASRAGLPTKPYRQAMQAAVGGHDAGWKLAPNGTPVKTVIVVDGHVVGAPGPAYVRAGCQQLAELAGTALLGAQFAASVTDAWTFVGATPLPDLRLGGEPLLDALASVLKAPEGATR